MRLAGVQVTLIILYLGFTAASDGSVWSYECRQSKCVKTEITDNNLTNAVSLPVCRIFCGEDGGTLWPKPTGPMKLGQYMVHINSGNIEFKRQGKSLGDEWEKIEERFKGQLRAKVSGAQLKSGGKQLHIKFSLDETSLELNSDTDESYKILLSIGNGEVFADIKAKNFYGARHGLETLSQLIVFDDIRKEIQIVGEGEINDAPAYKHRGLLLDTSRNYFSIDSIKRTIDAMSMVKLNVFHWHMTDSHSFPLVLNSHPDLSKYGAYSPKQTYTPEEITDVVMYGISRGVRVLPEFDAPAHVGEGWQKKDMTACFNAQPWNAYCVEPPCGQLDPTVDKLYDVLEDIYREMYEYFKKPDMFHMGGDEVSVECWNTSARIRDWMVNKGWKLDEDGFMKLWGHFQKNALERLDKVTGKQLPVIMWTSHLTEVPYVSEYLDKNRYIIQVWTTGADEKVQVLLKLGYKMIISNYDALYLDCGFGGWVTDGNNWCSPYIGWQKVYMNNLLSIAGKYHSQILGSEAAIWSEQVDEHTIDSRFWPRASALAERLWSNPDGSWRDAESRMLIHRERLVENGIAAESLQPQWCLQNEGDCPYGNKGA